MKGQISIEFLFNFLAMLFLISILLASLSHLLEVSKVHGWQMHEKAKIESFARTLDTAEAIVHEKFYSTGNYSLGDITNEGAIITEIEGEKIKGYTIYGIGGSDGEPI